MWIFLCLLSAVTSGLASIIMKKCSKNNNAKSIALIGLATSNILYIIVSILFTDVLTNFSIKNFLQIAPLTICQMIGYICGILSVKYASVSTVIPIRKCNTIVTLLLGIIINYMNINKQFQYVPHGSDEARSIFKPHGTP